MAETPRQSRFGTLTRGTIIGVLIAVYAWAMKQPVIAFAPMLLVAAGVQGAILLARKFVPAESMPRAMDIIETVADGGTVLLFALSVFGPVVRLGQSV